MLSNLIPWETGNKVEMCRCKVTGPNVGLYFSLNGYKCNLYFWHAQNEFPFLVHTCIDIQFERSRVPFRHWFHHGLYVGLHIPGNILLQSLSLYCFHCTRKRHLWDLRKNNAALSRSRYFPSHDDMQISLTMFLIDGTNILPVTPLPTKKTNKQQQQTTKTNQ